MLFLVSLTGHGQQFNICDQTGQIKRVTIANGTCSSQVLSDCQTSVPFSIAMLGNAFYYIDVFGDVYKATIDSTGIHNCTLVTNAGVIPNALTVDNNGILYYVAGNLLYSVDTANPMPKFLGVIPYLAGGDLTFYNNELYMASSDAIIKVNIANPAASTLYIAVSTNTFGFLYGMVTVRSNGKLKVYALGSAGNNTNLIELDMVNQQVVGITCTLPYVVYDAASETETGVVKKIKVEKIDIRQQCDVYNKGEIQINCIPDIDGSALTFTLNGNISNNTGLFTNLSAGIYYINIASTNGATKDTSVTVPDYNLTKPPIQVTKTNPVCNIDGKIQFNVANPQLYVIQYGNSAFLFDHVFTGLTTGNYHFRAVNQNGCIIDTMYVTLALDVCPPIKIDSIRIIPECDVLWKGNVQVYCAPHPDNYTFKLDQISNTTGLFNDLLPGNHLLSITSSGGFQKDTTVAVPDYRLVKPITVVKKRNQLCDVPGEITLTVNAKTDTTYKVKLGNGPTFPSGHVFKSLPVGNYSFTILSKHGCLLDTISITIQHDICKPIIFPNTFTPNSDGINDVFKPIADSNASGYTLTVYNRWGGVVFISTDLHFGWDGKYKGKNVETGTYYWLSTYTSIDGSKNTQNGFVTLIR